LEFTVELFAFFFLIAVLAGFLDTLAGGGGLITIPAFVMAGLSPLAALATNKLQASVGTATATYVFFKKRKVDREKVKTLMLSAFLGSAMGTIVVQFINVEVLSFIIPLVLFLTGSFFLLSPVAKEKDAKPKVSDACYQNVVVPTIGCYDGMLGPGTGSFFSLAGVSLKGLPLIDSTANAKTLNFSTNIASLIVFLFSGYMVWSIGVLMMLGQAMGAWLGVHSLFKINPLVLRPIIVTLCFTMLARYIWQAGWFSL
jgi:uncharacterized protein